MKYLKRPAVALLLFLPLILGSCFRDSGKALQEKLGEDVTVSKLAKEKTLYDRVLLWTDILNKSGWEISAKDMYYSGLDEYPVELLSERNLPVLLISPMGEWSEWELLGWLAGEAIRREADWEPLLASYMVHRTLEVLLYRELGPGSPEWTEYRNLSHDTVVWAQLTADLRTQIEELIVRCEQDKSLDYEALRTRLYGSWLADYNFRYTERFLTNSRLDFGEGMLSDEALFLLDLSATAFPELDRQFSESGDSLLLLYELAG